MPERLNSFFVVCWREMKNTILKIFVGLFVAIPCVSYGETSVTEYSGSVIDSRSSPIGQAHISCVGAGTASCVSIDNGTFRCGFTCREVMVSHVGYKSTLYSLTSGNNQIVLEEDSESLDEVDVVAGSAGNAKLVMRKPGKIESGVGPGKLEMKQPVNLNEQFCEKEYNGKKARWNKEKNTCDCPDSMVWNSGIQKCEDADLSALQDACWKIRKQATWDEEKNECVCNDENKEYKDGKCVKKKTEPETKLESKPEPKPKPKERTDEEKAAALAEKKSAWDDAKENEQSVANRTLTAATTAATGIGAMQLAQGLTEQKADAAADRDMTAYMATMRCSYADGKSVKAGAEEIELPGGNDANIMQYRNEYFALASSLKERKESLGMKPGIESEAILDKADMGLYDDENVGISGGNYASLYRAKTGSEADQALITSEQEKSANRVKYGGIALGAGVAVGIIGNSLINGKLGEKFKEAGKEKQNKSPNVSADSRPVIKHTSDPENMTSESAIISDDVSSNSGRGNGGTSVIGSLIETTGTSGANAATGGNVGGTSPIVASQRISYDEPDVDGTRWSESQYLQCFAHFFPKDKYSSNVRSYWAKSHNSQYCSGYTNAKYIYDFKKNPNTCSQQKFKSLNAGEWEIQIRNGNKSVKGIAVCNNTAGGQEDELRDSVGAHTDTGKHCWCKITQTDLDDCLVTQKFSWEYKGAFETVNAEDVEWFNANKAETDGVELYPAGYYQAGQNACLWECVDACAYSLFDYGRHRQRQMHGVPQIVDFVKKYNNM